MAPSGIIVVGLDTSSRAAGVLAQAVLLADKLGSKLVVVRAVGLPAEVPVEALGIAPDALPDTLLRLARRALDELLAGVPENLVESVETQLGAPWQVLCKVAADRKADLLVIGAHGHTMLIDRVLGTTASRVVNHAPCSVLVSREVHG
jgi:nucleotide-binding universal stress UspA family protein